MKIIKFLIFYISIIFFVSCEKHEILYNTDTVGSDIAEFQLHYFEPIVNTSANYIDSVFVNDVLYSSVNGSGQLATYNGVPGGDVGRFFAVKAGTSNLKLYRGGSIIYDNNVTLNPGKQNIFIHDLTKEPIVIDNLFSQYKSNIIISDVATWNTDSIATVRFYNFLYESDNTPYSGKLQYQFKNLTTGEYENLGKPVAFGEATDRVPVIVHKTYFNSSGYCRVYYRILTEDGTILKTMNKYGNFIDYSDWWTTYIGRAYNHILRGYRASTPLSSVSIWTSL